MLQDATAMTAELLGTPAPPRRAGRIKVPGVVYTPDSLVEFVLDEALADLDVLQAPGPLIDPACGDGAFLLALVKRLTTRVADARILTAKQRSEILEFVESNVFATDIDRDAVELARSRLRSLLHNLSQDSVPIPKLERNIVCQDFLLPGDSPPWEGHPAPPRLILGNPPYIAIDSLEEDYRAELRSNFQLIHGRFDMYLLFFEKAVDLLGPDGRLAFITPDKWLTSISAAKLRSRLSMTGTLERIALFDSHRVFPGAALVPAVTVWRKQSANGNLPVLTPQMAADQRVIVHHALLRNGEVVSGAPTKVPAGAILGAGTRRITRHKDAADIVSRLCDETPRSLSDFVTYASAGIATGFNPAFLLSAEDSIQVEPELLHDPINGRDINRFTFNDTSYQLLIPYYFSDEKARRVDINDFPRARTWLAQHRERLENRHCVRKWGKEWFDLHDPVASRLHGQTKILFPDLARRSRFALDEHGKLMPLHSAYYLIPTKIDPRVLVSVLNTSAIQLTLRLSAPRAKDGFSRLRKQFLLPVPIPVVPPSVEKEVCHAYDMQDFDTAVNLVTSLYPVPEADVAGALVEVDSPLGQA